MTAPFGSLYGLTSNNPAAIFPYASLSLGSRTWLDYRHPEWSANVVKYQYARDCYTGAVLDPDKIGSYLVRKKIGEALDAYAERQALADYTASYGLCVDALAGMLFHTDDDATRVWGELGAPEEPSTTIGALYRDADGYATIWKQLAIELVITHCAWLLVDVVNGAPKIKLIEPERVVDWGEDETGLAWVKVCEEITPRADWTAEPKAEKQYCLFTRQGWQRYREGGTSDKPEVVPIGAPGKYTYVDTTGAPQLPIFRVKLPLRRNIGFSQAKKAIAIFNQESTRDQSVRIAGFAKLFVKADNDTFLAIQKQLADGAFAIQEDPNVGGSGGANRFDTAPVAAAEIATKIVAQKTESFFRSFFREIADTANRDRVTATEVRSDLASGVGAFLLMEKAALDGAENQCLWRLEQAVFPNDPAKWHKARVERSANFQPLNPDDMVERLRARYLGQTTPVPVDRAALKEVLAQILKWDGIDLDDAALEAALDNHILLQTKDLSQVLTLPPAAKAQLAARWGQRLGITVDAGEAERIAGVEQQGRELMAQPFEPPPAAPKKEPPPTKKRTVKPDGSGGYTVEES